MREVLIPALVATAASTVLAQPGPMPPPPPIYQHHGPDASKTYAVPITGFPGDGPSDAKITMVVAHDYADPFSNRSRTTLDELRKKYGRELRIVFRNMVVHPRNAMAGALASCAAHRQKRFDELEDLLWEKGFQQRRWDQSDIPDPTGGTHKCWETAEGCPVVNELAQEAGLKMKRFRADMKSCEAEVNSDMMELQSSFGVNATPTFFINGRHLAGAMPTPEFERLIDEELAKATQRIKAGTPRARYYQRWVLDKGLRRLEPPQP